MSGAEFLLAIDPFTALTVASLGSQFLGGAPGAPGGAPGGAGGLSGLLAPLQGLGSKLTSLISGGPGRGEMRRASARSAVAQSAPLTRLQNALRGRNNSPAQIAASLREYFPRDPEARHAFGAVMARVAELGGSGKAQGQEANTLGDVLKWVLLSETVTKRSLPSDSELAAIVLGLPAPSTTPVAAPAAPAAPGFTAQPVGPPVVLPSSSLSPVAPMSAPLSLLPSVSGVGLPDLSPEATMPTLLDSFLPAISTFAASAFAPSAAASAPFVLPGGAAVAGLGGLAGLASQFMPSLGVPFVDIAPSGGAGLFEPFRRTASGARAQLHIQVNPVTEKPEFFAPVGRPLVFSRDFAVTKRMGRLGRKMVSATGGNRGRMVRRRRGGR